MNPIEKLIGGYKRFRAGPFEENRERYAELVAKGQKPKVCVIACSDSRVDPGIVLQTGPGDLFMVRNVANLVPPFEPDGRYHGTSAALEFAVQALQVEHIVVLGHAHCGGVRAMMGDAAPTGVEPSMIPPWVELVKAAHRHVLATMPDADNDTQIRACEQRAVLVSLENLTTFPWIRDKVAAGKLKLHGWYIDIATGELSAFDANAGKFEAV